MVDVPLVVVLETVLVVEVAVEVVVVVVVVVVTVVELVVEVVVHVSHIVGQLCRAKSPMSPNSKQSVGCTRCPQTAGSSVP